MAQRQFQRGKPNYIFSLNVHKAFYTAPHGAAHLTLRHLFVPPAVIDLLLFLRAAAQRRFAPAYGFTLPVHMQRGVRKGNPETLLRYTFLLEPLLGAQGHRLHAPGGAERGFI